jgi:hypothetical protein
MADDKKSIIDLFKPPESYKGIIMALSAMSADKKTLESVSRTFTNRQFRNGYIFGHLFLDRRTEGVWKEGRVFEGIYHCQNKKKIQIDNLLHAKVFLLGFGKVSLGEPTYFRVIVYTGNLTQSSVNNLLELLWTFDLNESEQEKIKKIDFYRIADFFEQLSKRYYSIPAQSSYSLKDFLSLCKKRSGDVSKKAIGHFFHSFEKPLIEHIKLAIGGKKGLNSVLCGSGFFEKAKEFQNYPETIEHIEQCITNSKGGVEIGQIVLNPDLAGAIANWQEPNLKNWSFHIPKDGNNRISRRLHAKYILFYSKINQVGGGAKCERGVLYLGSGNISKQGLINSSKAGGNIECGVVIELHQETDIFTKLFLGEEYKGEIKSGEGGSDEDLTDQVPIPFCPILALKVVGTSTKIIWCDADVEENDKVEIDGKEYIFPEELIDSNIFKTSQVILYGGIMFSVPVISQNGLICERDYKIDTFQDALNLLSKFYEQTLDDEEFPEVVDGGTQSINNNIKKEAFDSGVIRKYPLHTAAELIEKIASINKSFDNNSCLIPEWLEFLDNHFVKLFKQSDINGWQELKFNFLSVLKLAPFSISESENLKNYQEIIDKIITKWEMNGLEEL